MAGTADMTKEPATRPPKTIVFNLLFIQASLPPASLDARITEGITVSRRLSFVLPSGIIRSIHAVFGAVTG